MLYTSARESQSEMEIETKKFDELKIADNTESISSQRVEMKTEIEIENKTEVKNEVKVRPRLSHNSLPEYTKLDTMKNIGQFTCPNFRYINRIRARKEFLVRKSELFINPITQQQIFVSDEGIFLCGPNQTLIPLTNLKQIIKKENCAVIYCNNIDNSSRIRYTTIPSCYESRTALCKIRKRIANSSCIIIDISPLLCS